MQAIEALAAEGGDQRRVDVEDALGPLGRERLAQDAHKAGEDDHLRAALAQRPAQRILEGLLTAAGAPLDDDALYARARRALEGIGLGIARRDEDDLTARDLSGRLRVEQRLQVRSAAGDEHGDPCFQHRTTFSSPSVISPMT